MFYNDSNCVNSRCMILPYLGYLLSCAKSRHACSSQYLSNSTKITTNTETAMQCCIIHTTQHPLTSESYHVICISCELSRYKENRSSILPPQQYVYFTYRLYITPSVSCELSKYIQKESQEYFTSTTKWIFHLTYVHVYK